IRTVIDCGLARRARYDPGRGMSRLITERVTRAEADQRTGRAGRVGPGVCQRLWTKGEERGMQAFPPPEIAAADLSGLVLELALWGALEPDGLAFLSRPPAGAWASARALLHSLGALDDTGRITDHGRSIVTLPLHPRIAHMLSVAGPAASELAALLNDRDPLRNAGTDIRLRIAAIKEPGRHPSERKNLERVAAEARRLRFLTVDDGTSLSAPQQAALAYPDRIGMRRDSIAARWILSGGSGATMDEADPLAGQRLIVATDLEGSGRDARIRQAVAITEAELRAVHGRRIKWVDVCRWSKPERRVVTRRQERFQALVLDDRRWDDAPSEALAEAMLDGVRHLGLPWSDSARRLRARVEFLRTRGAALPDCSDSGLMGSLEDWLLPWLAGFRTAADLDRVDLVASLRARLGRREMDLVDRQAPKYFHTPLGKRRPIDYGDESPAVAVRLQEMFGVTRHPSVGPERIPLRLTLLSPGERPLAVTTDLPGFWNGAYSEVRKTMRGRYPKHPWPDDPARAAPTSHARRRPKRS
ncbi:MAG: ATP-dependent helicase HrpB, partial [Rhodobacter sp.]|nr:ATP-dependent helicase HrpB [Rhodobacter sp.]